MKLKKTKYGIKIKKYPQNFEDQSEKNIFILLFMNHYY
jgi:hypothetical protein